MAEKRKVLPSQFCSAAVFTNKHRGGFGSPENRATAQQPPKHFNCYLTRERARERAGDVPSGSDGGRDG